MAQLTWGPNSYFESGIDQAVIYLQNMPGIAWPGLVSVEEDKKSSGTSSLYFDGVKTKSLKSSLEMSLNVNSFYLPDECKSIIGEAQATPGLVLTNQKSIPFGFSYRTKLGINQGTQGYRIHLFYDVLSVQKESSFKTKTDNWTPTVYAYTFFIKPVNLPGLAPVFKFIFDSSKMSLTNFNAVSDILYGTEGSVSRLPTIDELMTLGVAEE